LSYLDDDDVGCKNQGLLNSLLDYEIDNEGDFGSEYEDPFTFPKQKILEEIMMETEARNNSLKK
jgi:hypothetical protein